VALAAGVTKGTVSRALRGKAGISEKTRDRVMAAASKLKYRRSTDYQRRGRTHVGQIGFLVIDPSASLKSLLVDGKFEPYLFPMIEGCMAEAVQRSESVSVSHVIWEDLAAGRMPAALSRQHVDGLIVRGFIDDQVANWLGQLHLQVVLVDCDQHLPDFSHVRIEHVRAMDGVVEHLVSKGCDKIATICGSLDHLNGQERLAGLRVAMSRRGLALAEHAIAVGRHGFTPDEGREGVAELLDAAVPFDALVCQSDLIARGALEQLRKRGLRVPADVRVVGFDDVIEARFYDPPLTTVRVPTYGMGQAAADLLYEEMDRGNSKRQSILIETELVERQST